MAIYDAFMFFNELDLLEFRLSLLHDLVDRFVIVESNKTHSNQDKDFHIESNWSRFQPYHDKIEYVRFTPDTSGMTFQKAQQYTQNDDFWRMENAQRNALVKGLTQAGPNDLILIGDIDEIPSREFVQYLKREGHLLAKPYTLLQKLYYYYMNCAVSAPMDEWSGTVVAKRGHFPQHSTSYLQEMRDNRQSYEKYVNAGWHFSFLGGARQVNSKITAFCHSEYQRDKFTDIDQIQQRMEQNKDPFDRNYRMTLLPVNHHPQYLQDAILKYPHFHKQPTPTSSPKPSEA